MLVREEEAMEPTCRAPSRAGILRFGAAASVLAALKPAGAFAAAPAAAPVAPAVALARLTAGNARFVGGTLSQQSTMAERRVALAGHQAPFAAILSCSDSRVPPELIFDQNVGDLFVFRNAGNFVDGGVLGTMEYGYGNLGIRLFVVVGHEECGAVKATYSAVRDKKRLPRNLDVIEDAIAPGIDAVVAARGTTHAAVVANAKAQAGRFARSPVLGPAIARGDIRVVPAEYDFTNGRVRLLGAA